MVDLTNIFCLHLDIESITKIISEKVPVITINNMIIVGRVSKLCAVAVNLHLPVCLFVWTCATNTVCTFPNRRICICGNVHIYVQFCVLLQRLNIYLSGLLPRTPCVLFHIYRNVPVATCTYMCTLCVVNVSGHLPCIPCLHTLHIVCCRCLCNLFKHISVRGNLPHKVISIHVGFKSFF